MRFNTQKLLAAVEAEIARREKAAEEAFSKAVEEYEAQKAEWLASDHPAALRDCARLVVEKVRKGRIVTPDDVEPIASDRYRAPRHLFYAVEPKRETEKRKPNVSRLNDLREVLLAVEDDEITSSGLRDLGFRNIGDILRSAVA